MLKGKVGYFILSVILLFVAASRLLPHEPNFSPITAMVFFAVLVAPRAWVGLALSLAFIFVSDLVIGLYPGIFYNYLGYVAIGGTGLFMRSAFNENSRVFRTLSLVVALLSGAVFFFIFSNLGVWMSSGLYTKNIEGLMECYFMAIPFFRATLVSHVLMSVVLLAVDQFAMKPLNTKLLQG